VFFSGNAGGFDIRDCPSPEENARRLVACWNASEGLSTEELETAGNSFNGWRLASYAMNDAKAQRDELQKALMSIEAKVDALIAQRDELLEALKDVLAWGTDENYQHARASSNKARAAIAKVEGGAA
jgi:hypothetical protein